MDKETFQNAALRQIGELMKIGAMTQEQGATLWFAIIPTVCESYAPKIEQLDGNTEDILSQVERWLSGR